MLIVVPYTAGRREAWDTLCDQGDDAWLWHRREWIYYSVAFLGAQVFVD